MSRPPDYFPSAEWDRRFRFHLLREAVNQVYERGMDFQDEPWWPEFDALGKALNREGAEVESTDDG